MERLRQDIRFAIRILLKDRAFAVTALLTLAVCIGANATIFAVVNSILLRPLPVPESEQLVHIYNSYPRAGVERASNGVPDYYDRLRELEAFEELALYGPRGVTIGGQGEPQRVTAMVARPSLLRMLRVEPVRGRVFHEDEGEPGRSAQVILTYALWQQLFAGRDSAVGEQLRVNGEPRTIVGVLPAAFRFDDPDVRLWMPAAFSPEERSDEARHSNNWSMVGRLKPGATVAQAQQQLDALNQRNLERFPVMKEILVNAGFHTVARPLQDDIVRDVRATLYLLWGGALFVLLIGAVNLTNLVLVRSSARAREMATRHALGAGLSRLARQLLTETVLLTVAGGILGLAFGVWGLSLLQGLGIDTMPRAGEVRMDGVAVAFTAGLAVATGMLIGIAPVATIRRMNLSQAFREEGRSGTTSRGARAVRRLLVASQIAFAFMLLIGAGLLLASFQRVLAIDPGFESRGVLTARVAPPASRYADAPELRQFQGRLLERLRSLPGVQRAALTSSIPFGNDYSDSVIMAEGYQMAPGESLISPYSVSVSPGYFEALDIPLKAGRLFAESDTEGAPRVVIIDEKLARHFWPGGDAIGKRLYNAESAEDFIKMGPTARFYNVVGVVSEIRIAGLVAADDRVGTYYFPLAQDVRRTTALTLRTSGDPVALTAAVRRELAAIDPELPLYSVMTMDERISGTLVDRRTPMLLAAIFAGVALFLAALGIYGVLAYQVSQRRREIGIRLALGSASGGIFTLVLREGLALLAAGLVAGTLGAFALRGLLQSQLYGVGAMDPVVLTSVALVLAAAAIVACVIPARRAARIDPILALTDL